MSVPQPSIALEGHCSSIDNDTLYVLSPAGLQSLPLKKNATWSEEPNGQSVTGPTCVTSPSQGALYVIGGLSSDDSYNGLQRYFFGNKTWETLSPPADVMQGRTNHSAAYLSDSESILVYAGSQSDAPSDMSSQTFAISTQPPYNIRSFTSQAPPTNQPILTPWNSSHAVMVGGSPYNTEVFTFEPTVGWQQLSTNLTDTIDSASRGLIVDGSDGSKVLELYNVKVSPNTVSQIVLLDANGQPAATGETIGSSSSSRKRKRDLSLSNWPSYNSSGAPTATRTDCAVVQGSSGVAVISGGNGDSPLAMFDQTGNGWVDASKFFDSKDQQPLQPSSTTSATSSMSATSSSKPSKTATAGSGSGLTSHQRMLRTLGITLGVLCGIAAIFIFVLLFLRWRRTRQTKQEDYHDEKPGNRMSFADRGASFMKEAGGSINELAPPAKDRYKSGAPSGGSHSSLAIITGKFGNSRNTPSHQPKASYESTMHLVKDRNGAHNTGEPMEMVDIGDKGTPVQRKPLPRTELTPPAAMAYDSKKELAPMDDRNRSSGWSKYFATSGPTGPNGLSHLPGAYLKPQSNSSMSDDRSVYTSGVPSHPSRIPSSVLVPPLDIDFSKTLDGQRLSHVTSGSPSFNHSREDLAKRGSTAEMAEGFKGLIVTPRPDSLDRRSQISGYSLSSANNRTTVGSTLSSNLTSDYYNESGHTPWTPTSANFKELVNSRPSSSNYTASVNEPHVPSRGKSAGFFPGSGTSYRPTTKSKMSSTAALTSDWAAPHPNGLGVPKLAEDRDSTLTVFPRGVPSAYYADREKAKESQAHQAQLSQAPQRSSQKAMVSDMSWLNLGLGGGQNRI
ncbi:hypothetical protein LTR36_005341 [Oleoguttula mirabilis]|uniref:Pre-mRNA splicing factor CLF1 n=1 Tax=Oleoguttula mirabilis TaxID=1507867 RepID=A0AAV9JFZ2_9PEZI|nr:hypothetical protein LTR36_005341 [Oleoguttula mirabilis]